MDGTCVVCRSLLPRLWRPERGVPDRCPTCADTVRLPTLLVVTGAAATGKSAIGRALRRWRSDLIVLDGDTIADGAVSVRRDPPDYEAFWRYALRLMFEVTRPGDVVVHCGMGLPAADPEGVDVRRR